MEDSALELKVGDKVLGTPELDQHFRRWPVDGIEGYISILQPDYCTVKFNYVGVVKNIPIRFMAQIRQAYLDQSIKEEKKA